MSPTSKFILGAAMAASVLGFGSAVAQDSQPNVRLARDLVAAASAFETFTRTAGAIDAGFAGPRDVAGAVQVGAAHDPRQLAAGMVAYGAMTALQDPEFVTGVERILADPVARERLLQRLIEEPESAAELPGSASAARRTRSALLRQVEPMLADGERVKQAAYDMQRQGWSKAMVSDARERLALVKQLAGRAFTPDEDDAARLFTAVSTRIEASSSAPPSPVVLRSLAVAALALAGRADEDHAAQLASLLTEPSSAGCVRIAKLNLFQCMAVAGPHYEDVFCLGQHAMLEPGRCIADALGAETPAAAGQPADRLQAAQARGVAFPVASRDDSRAR